MRYPWVNIALLVLLAVQLLTGFAGLIAGSEEFRWVLWLHGVGGYALVVLSFWKARIIVDVFRRRRSLDWQRLSFVLFALLTLVILATGFSWTVAGPLHVSGFSLMTVHAVLALVLVAFFVWHTVAKRIVFRVPRARDRRAFLRLAATGAAGLALWQVGRRTKAAYDLPGSARRFTGSYETGSFSGVFPVVTWLFDYPNPVDLGTWQLVVEGAVDRPLALTYEQLSQLPGITMAATLDCTGGWYSAQEWQGIELAWLLERSGVNAQAQSVTVEAVSGYGRRFPVEAARGFLLATHVAGQPLLHGHGAPLRLVAPGRRGFDWVKWVTRVRVNETSHLLQPPLPLQ
jgi:hypothetical protein